jgi:hypothetical protein
MYLACPVVGLHVPSEVQNCWFKIIIFLEMETLIVCSVTTRVCNARICSYAVDK